MALFAVPHRDDDKDHGWMHCDTLPFRCDREAVEVGEVDKDMVVSRKGR